MMPTILRSYKNILPVGEFDQMKVLLLKLGVSQKKIDDALRKTWSGKQAENVLIGGWGERLLQQAVDFVYSRECLPNYDLLTYQSFEWNALSKHIWSLGCAHKNPIV